MDRLTARLLDDALAKFTEYFVKNYPGPNTVIHDPKWHAPKIFRAAQLALDAVGQSLSQEAVRDGALREAVKRYLKEQGDESWWTASERRLAITLKREPNAAARVDGPAQGWILEPRELKLLIDYHDAKGCEAEAMGVNGSVRYHDKRRAHYEALLPPGASDE